MKPLLFFLLMPVFFVSCGDKKAVLKGDPKTVEEFLDLFPETRLPYTISDSLISRKQTDSSMLKQKVYSSFIPDSAFSQYYGKSKPGIYPLGKNSIKKGDTWLFVKTVAGSKKAAYMIVFDADKKFVAAKPVLFLDKSSATSQQAELDSRYTITKLQRRKTADGTMLYRKDAFVYSDGAFILILTESNEKTAAASSVLNPIDTFPRKNKYSGDYVMDRRNFVSIRDGKRTGTFLFFIHFEKDKGTCIGELKGEADIKSAGKAVFHQKSGPCVVEFTFNGNTVRIKETGACGSYRDIKCFFEGAFAKKKGK